ncbi:MAG TPA: sensor histidine kinase [Candidatus Limnocylindrales bacterium]|nr:sensor histidine kinase [Candidatus Limnocylindrales bacterium]
MTGVVLLQLTLRRERDIFAIRQRGREAAAAMGLEHQDQIRIATALSDIGRQMLSIKGAAVEVGFHADAYPARLRIELAVPQGPYETTLQTLEPVARLVDTLEVRETPGRTVVAITRALPGNVGREGLTEVAERAKRALADAAVAQPLDELALQNEHLLSALDDVRRQRDRLEVLNNELQETNKGVMALYLQLSNELEETNRGVVALYAELDDKSDQLRASSEAKTRFLANVSHELRAPVTAVIGLIRLLSDPDSDPLTSAQSEQIELIRSSAVDLLALVNDLLDLAKAESGRIVPAWSRVDLRELFGQLRGTVMALLPGPQVQLRVDDPPEGSTIESDEALLSQVLRNLLHNAVKFTERGSVRMSAERQDGQWVFAVEDTGIGIPLYAHERIFEEFYQVPTRVTAGGTGLGLPYARKVVTLLGGSLTLRSEPGRGSVFTVTLPVRRPS